SRAGIEGDVLVHRLVGIEANLGVRPAAGFLLSEVNESATDPLALTTRVDGDIVEKQMVFFLEQDEDTGNLAGKEIAAMGDGERRARAWPRNIPAHVASPEPSAAGRARPVRQAGRRRRAAGSPSPELAGLLPPLD